ncbi:MAG: hypothetical protein H6R14_1842 [Proteobacteria bacterium]|nr:hypothetical protein [Pseudomonadota bacterium]
MPSRIHVRRRQPLNAVAIVIFALIGCSAQAQTSEPANPPAAPFNDKKESHHHKHQLPPETPIPHRLDTAPTQPHPQAAKLEQQRAVSLPQK